MANLKEGNAREMSEVRAFITISRANSGITDLQGTLANNAFGRVTGPFTNLIGRVP